MIKSRLLSNFKNISHGFFNSEGGYSSGIYKSLNCGIGSKDKKRRVLLNLKKVSKRIKVANNNLVLLNQIHSNRVKFVNKNTINRFVGDSLVTNKRNLALGILTADCAPVLIFDPKKQNIAALHAGWKGAYKNIIKNTIKKLRAKGSKTRDLIEVNSIFNSKFLVIDFGSSITAPTNNIEIMPSDAVNSKILFIP